MSYFTGETIAFSHKGGFWKTRYSFTPTCYAAIDNVMISTNGVHDSAEVAIEGNGDLFWEHDKVVIESNSIVPNHNTFYGKRHKSKITVVSNQDPSAVKIFKSLSLESNSNSWVGMAGTNINPLGSPQDDLQLGDIKGFITKESNQYSELPRSLVNSSSNISFACMLDFILPESINGFEEINLSVTGWAASVAVPPSVSLSCGVGTVALFYDTTGFKYLSLNDGVVAYTTFEAAVSNNAVYVRRYDAIENEILFGGRYSENFSLEDLTIDVENLDLKLCIASSPDINGDPMRGHYLYLNLVNDSTTPVETYAINVDFENTKLDHSKVAKKKTTGNKKASPTKK
tara:strand:+ start:1261 stop:2289 length:1029 start_codon:yes stop_codon:yes gene_type:complete